MRPSTRRRSSGTCSPCSRIPASRTPEKRLHRRSDGASPEPRVSILLPARDAAGTLAACLGSVARQTETRWECVIVDDGSRDATSAIARAFQRRDPRFVLVTVPRAGLVAALSAGLARCRGPLVARMDADDLMHRRRLEKQRAALEADRGLAAVGCRVRMFPRAVLRPGLRAYERWLNGMASAEQLRAEAYVECPLAHPSLMIRREILSAFGYRDRGWPEDYDLVLRLLAAGHRIGVVPARLLMWRDGPGRLWRTSPDYALDRFLAVKAHFLASGFLGGNERYILWGYGSTGKGLRRALALEGKRPAFVVDLHPGRLGSRIHGAPVVPPEALPALPRLPILVSVARAKPRAEIRAALAGMAFREVRDFICAA